MKQAHINYIAEHYLKDQVFIHCFYGRNRWRGFMVMNIYMDDFESLLDSINSEFKFYGLPELSNREIWSLFKELVSPNRVLVTRLMCRDKPLEDFEMTFGDMDVIVQRRVLFEKFSSVTFEK